METRGSRRSALKNQSNRFTRQEDSDSEKQHSHNSQRDRMQAFKATESEESPTAGNHARTENTCVRRILSNELLMGCGSLDATDIPPNPHGVCSPCHSHARTSIRTAIDYGFSPIAVGVTRMVATSPGRIFRSGLENSAQTLTR